MKDNDYNRSWLAPMLKGIAGELEDAHADVMYWYNRAMTFQKKSEELQFTPGLNAYLFAANMYNYEAVRYQYEKFCKMNEVTTRGILPDLEVEADPTLAEIAPGVIQ